ncbi:MAG: peptidylprolyl isomerase [Anaerolineae bacterium]|nr:peptidylprolyl isomerase [Phycisphaerae bacterium]
MKPHRDRKNWGNFRLFTIILTIAISGCANKDAPAPVASNTPNVTNPSGNRPPATSNPPANPGATQSPNVNATPPTPANSGDDVIAVVGNTNITRRQLEKPLVEAYGLNMLAKVAQLELAKQEAKARSLNVTPTDVTNETERYLATLFNEEKDRDLHLLNVELEKAEAAKNKIRAEQIRNDIRKERNMLLEQLLQQQKVSRTDFNIVMETNTNLRALAESVLKAQGPPDDEALRKAFNHLYGEKAVVRDIQVADLKEATEVKRRLSAGDAFEVVAREMSRHPPSAALGGELQPFSRDTPDFPTLFKDVAFALKIGEVSDATLIGDAYHIIKLEQRIPPKLLKFEDVKNSVREFLVARQLEVTVQGLRASLQRDVVTSLKINEPVLKEQYDAQRNRKVDELQDKNEMKRALDRNIEEDRAKKSEPATAPAMPATVPATVPPVAPPTTRPTVVPTTSPTTQPTSTLPTTR